MKKIAAFALLTAGALAFSGNDYQSRPAHSSKSRKNDPRKWFDIEGTKVFAMNKQEAKKKFFKGVTR